MLNRFSFCVRNVQFYLFRAHLYTFLNQSSLEDFLKFLSESSLEGTLKFLN